MTQTMSKKGAINLAAVVVDGITLAREIWIGVNSREELIGKTANFIMGAETLIRETEKIQRQNQGNFNFDD